MAKKRRGREWLKWNGRTILHWIELAFIHSIYQLNPHDMVIVFIWHDEYDLKSDWCELISNSTLATAKITWARVIHVFKIYSRFFPFFSSNFRLKALCIHVSFEVLNVHSLRLVMLSHSKCCVGFGSGGGGDAAVDIAADVLISNENICSHHHHQRQHLKWTATTA